MAASDGSIIIDAEINSRGFDRGVDRMQGKIGGLGQAVKKLGGIIATVFAAKALVDFGRQAIEIGSSVAEVQNVVDTAFGDMSGRVEEFARNSIQQFGMSQLAAKKTASTYMAMARGMGLPMETAADMSLSLTGLTADVASFYNISQELADIKLKSVFTGETESLKDLGVVMTQTNLKQFALEQGITKSLDKMTQSELVMLRYKYVMEQLALANGDFAKTSDSWANQTRILQMQWQEFMSVVGQSLITVLTPLVKVLNRIVATLIQVANAVNAVISRIFGGANQQIQQTQANAAGVGAAIEDSTEAQDGLTDATKKTSKAQEKMLAGFDTITKIGKKDTGGGSGAGAGGAGGLDGLDTGGLTFETDTSQIDDAMSKVDEFMERLKDAFAPFQDSFDAAFAYVERGAQHLYSVFQKAWEDIKSLGTPLKEWFTGDFFDFLKEFILTCGVILGGILDTAATIFDDLWSVIIFPSLDQMIRDVLPMLTQFVTQFTITFRVLFGEVKRIFDRLWKEGVKPALDIIAKIWLGLWDGVVKTWNKYGEPIFKLIREAIHLTADLFLKTWETVWKPIWDVFMKVLDEVWTNHFKPLWDNILDFVGLLAQSALEIYNKFIIPVSRWFVETFGPDIAKAISYVIQYLGKLVGDVADFASKIINFLKGIVNFLTGVFTGDWKRALDGLKQSFGAVFEALGVILQTFRDTVDFVFGAVEGIVTKALDTVKNALKTAVNLMLVMAETFINGFIRGINSLIKALNKLSFNAPDWVPGIGGKSFGINIPTAQEVRLPRLAQGAVIPPNREFLAVLGDQSSGTNIETPLDTMVDAFRRVMQEYGGGTVAVTVNIDGEQIGRYMERAQRQNARRFGR